MSMPTIPSLDPSINLTRDDSINIILSSIGMEELSLAHILNAEAEKIQFALGTLETATEAASLEDIMTVNSSAKKMLRDVIKNACVIISIIRKTSILSGFQGLCLFYFPK